MKHMHRAGLPNLARARDSASYHTAYKPAFVHKTLYDTQKIDGFKKLLSIQSRRVIPF
jgi:hypothetical protein